MRNALAPIQIDKRGCAFWLLDSQEIYQNRLIQNLYNFQQFKNYVKKSSTLKTI